VTTITSASANETSSAVRDTAGRTAKPLTIIGGLKSLFRAVAKAVAERIDGAPRPTKARRRKSGEDTRELFPRARHMATARAKPIAAATAYLAQTLDWLQLWEHNADVGSNAASSYTAGQDQFTPKL
jgi:hypothetical protein